MMEDPTSGNKDFETFLKERSFFSYLEFVWACKGMRALINEDNLTSKQIVNSIYTSFITSGSLSRVLSSGTLLKIVERMMHIMYNEHHNLSRPSYYYSQTIWNATNPSSSSSLHSSHPILSTPSTEEYKTIFNSAEAEVSVVLEKLYEDFRKGSCQESGDVDEYLLKSKLCKSLRLQQIQCAVKPEEFAKELCNKLESIELEDNCEEPLLGKRAKLDKILNGKKCDECTQKEDTSKDEFSAKLAKAIEHKLMLMRQLEDSNFDMGDECRAMDLESQTESHNHEYSHNASWWISRRKRIRPGFMTIRDCFGQQESESEEYSQLIPSDIKTE